MGIFIYISTSNLNVLTGVAKKIKSQCLAFERLGHRVIHLGTEEPIHREYLQKLSMFYYGEKCKKIKQEIIKLKGEDVTTVYIRHSPSAIYGLLDIMKIAREQWPKVKILLEIPSYPYEAECSDLKSKPMLYRDKLHRHKLKRYVDRVLTLTDHEEIFGIPTIKFKNGYDFTAIPTRTPTPQEPDSTDASDSDAKRTTGTARTSGEAAVGTPGEIRLCCVAMFAFWHGYERLLNGLANYYKAMPREQQQEQRIEQGRSHRQEQRSQQRRKIIIHFAGDGKELALYKQLTEKLGLGEHVVFHGRLDNEALRNLYNNVDIGMNSLGIYKAGGTVGMQLKTREYLAAGLPIVTGVHLDLHDYPEFRPYLLEFPNDPSPIDIQRIVDFYDRLNLSSTDEATRIAQYLHETGEKYLGMGAAMKEVVDYIKESCGNTTHEITADQ